MMDNWLTYEEFQAQYPDSALTEEQFTPLALDAAFFIETATRWTASLADTPDQQQLLRQCQAKIVRFSEQTSASWDGVTSVSNHGYTESYASGKDLQAYIDQQQTQIVNTVLSAPATRWMLNAGGVYHPPRRR